jgi:adenylate kinase
MGKSLIFIGGSKGVGKTVLARAVSSILDFEYVNTGERFRRYRPDFDKKFVQELIDTKKNFIIDTHYAASSNKTPYDFHMGIDEKYQMHLRFNARYSGKVILIEATPEIVLERRKKDGEERRCLNLEQIIKENNFNSAYSSIYASCLNMPHLLLKNENLSIEEATNKLLEIIKNE